MGIHFLPPSFNIKELSQQDNFDLDVKKTTHYLVSSVTENEAHTIQRLPTANQILSGLMFFR